MSLLNILLPYPARDDEDLIRGTAMRAEKEDKFEETKFLWSGVRKGGVMKDPSRGNPVKQFPSL